MDDGPDIARTRSIGVRIVFAVVMLVIPIQLLVKAAVGREPYPALTQPAFAYSANALERANTVSDVRVQVEVTFSDRTVETFTAEQLVPWSAGISPTTIISESMIDRAPEPETISWLASQIEALRPDAPPQSARVLEFTVRTDASTLEVIGSSPSDDVTVSFTSRP